MPKHLKNIAVIAIFGFAMFFGLAAPAAAKDMPLFTTFDRIDTKTWYLSHGWTNGSHQSCEWDKKLANIRDRKLVLTIAKHIGKVRPMGCPELQTHARVGYGRFETRMRAAAGSGLNTAFFTYIGPPMGVPDHDEIDFEFLGKHPTQVELTHWTAGKQYPGKVLDLGFDASKEFHDYAFEWTPSAITWFVDGREVYKTPVGVPLPKNPQKIFFSLWSGSPENEDWLGPFKYERPVTAEIVWMKYTPYTP